MDAAEILDIAVQVASALEGRTRQASFTGHQADNIMIRRNGYVKVLDLAWQNSPKAQSIAARQTAKHRREFWFIPMPAW